MEKEKLLGLMKGQLIVSCQALPGEAFYDETISLMDSGPESRDGHDPGQWPAGYPGSEKSNRIAGDWSD